MTEARAADGRRGWKLAFVTVTFFLFVYFCSKVSAVLNPVLVAFLIAYIFEPVIAWFERRKMSRLCGILVIFMFIGAVFAHLLLFAVPETLRQGRMLTYDLAGDHVLLEGEGAGRDLSKPPFLTMEEPFVDTDGNAVWDEGESFRDWNRNGKRDAAVVYEDTNGSGNFEEGYLSRAGQTAGGWLTSLNERIREAGGEPIEINSITDKLREYVRQNLQVVARKGVDVVSDVASLLGAGVNMVLVLLTVFMLVPFYTFYIMTEMPALKRLATDHLPFEYRERILKTFGRIHRAMSGFFRGMLIVCSVKATILSIGMFFVGVPYALVFGVLAGFGTIIPIFGVAMFMIPAILITGLQFGMGKMIAVIVVYILAESLDGWLVSPFVMGSAVELHPMIILLAVLAGGELLGMFGMLIAVPVAAIIKILFSDYILPHLDELAKADGKAAG